MWRSMSPWTILQEALLRQSSDGRWHLEEGVEKNPQKNYYMAIT